ncbi:MAG: magnesium/cobalt transporter CorA [Phycisphaerae bacterium]|nr:magnesium/cobalt transporter CorA [Phycisphaerae bacterium]
MARLFPSLSRKRNLPPGTPVYVGAPRAEPVRITVIDYDPDRAELRAVDTPQDCFAYRDNDSVTWINVDGVHEPQIVQALGRHFGLHPLVQEDILNTTQQPKCEDFGDYVCLFVKMLQWSDDADGITSEHVSLILGRGFVISFQQRSGDVFQAVRDRIRDNAGRIRTMGADYLAYALLDAVVDGYFAALEQRAERIESIEAELVERPTPTTLAHIHRLRREGLMLRRAVRPTREMTAALDRGGSALISPEVAPYLRDLYDHAVQVIDTAETFREMLTGMLDTYLSSQSNRMNEVMKVLTMIATIFIPLTFIAGIYGMNFQHMPELTRPWAYPAVLGVMAVITLAMLVWFRRKRWL